MKAYFSCGAGDFISIESFLTDDEKKSISSFVLFTRSAYAIEQIIRLHPIWASLPVLTPLSSEEIKAYGVYSFFNIAHLEKITGKKWFDSAIDFSGEILYPQILKGQRKYTESLCEIEKVNCGIVVDAESNNDDRLVKKGRNLTVEEIQKIKIENKDKDIKFLGVGKTTLSEALGYVKGCQEFYGVDSMLAAYAARCPSIKKIIVKTVNPIYKRWRPIYDPHNRIKVVDGIK